MSTRITTQVDKEAWDSQFVLLPPQEYRLRYLMPKIVNAKTSGQPMLEFRLDILSPETVNVGGKDVKVAGKQKMFDRVSLSPKASGILRQKLVGAGVPFTLNGDALDFDYADFQGKEIIAKVEIRKNPDDGRESNQITHTRPA